ncbi:MAG: cell division ATP-binding protein FtsE [Nitrospirae bacterium]|nr:cell division ATP-binding protein FtsE [Nitrospirota bacterium]
MVQLFHVSAGYGKDTPALSEISFSLDKGEFAFLTGPSGAGKTTLLRILYAALRPASGQVLVGGRNLARIRQSEIPYLRRMIGVVFQDFHLLSRQTVFENVALPLEIRGFPKREVHRRVASILKLVGLGHRSQARAEQLSGGEQQRTAIARAIVGEPALVLADEPTGNLDDALAGEIMELLDRINFKGATVVVATHNRWLLQQYPRRTLTLEHGRLVGDT